MKKISLSLIALAALSTAALASDRTDIDARDVQPFATATAGTMDTQAIMVAGEAKPVSNFDRLNWTMMENESSGN